MATFRTLGVMQPLFRDVQHGGSGRIAGTVKVKTDPVDAPLRRKVRLHRDIDGLKVGETWSDATTGAYEFRSISMDYRYTVISYDHLHSNRAVISDNQAPEVMT